jgi:NitT/TauT family transport system substrate-binding protein
MINKKISIVIALLLVFTFVLTGCEEGTKEAVDVTIAGLKGPTSIGMIQLIDSKALDGDHYNVEYVVEGAPDNLIGKIINGEVDIAAVPTNAASVIYNKTEGDVKFLALNTLGVIYVVGTEDVNSIADLEGKKVAVSGKGATPEYAFNYLLDKNNLTDEVETEFLLDHSSLAQTVIAEDNKIAVLPQPFVTQVMMNNPNVEILIDLNKEWENATNGESVLAMGCLVVNSKFAEEQPFFIEEFLSEYKSSVEWVNNNYEEAGQLVEKNGILPNAKLAEKAIPNCSIVFKDAQEAKDEVQSFLSILHDFNPDSVGGKLPDEDFYYSKP